MQVGVRYEITVEAWAEPAEGTTLDELIARMKELGNEVLRVDREGNRLLVAFQDWKGD